MRGKRLVWTLACGVLASGMLLAGCGGKSSGGESGGAQASVQPSAQPSAEKAEPFTITLRHTQIKDTQKKRLAMLQDVVKATENEVPGLKIELDGVEDKVNRFEKLRAEMAAGNPPQIFDLFGGTDTRDYVKAGRLLDVTPILEELGLKDKFYSLAEFTVDGKVYGLPMAGYVEGLYYNKKIFADNGVQPPKTWDELLKAAETFKSKGITPFALASKDAWVINMMMNTMWVYTAGPTSVEDIVAGKKKWNDPDMLDAFKKYETLVKKGYFQEGNLALAYAEQQNKFAAGEAAMVFDGSWANTPLTDPEKSKVANDVGFMLFPALGGPGDGYINGGWSNGYGFSVKVKDNPRELAAVKAFIKNMYNEQMQKRQLLEEGMLPALKLSDTSGVKPIIAEILSVSSAAKGTFPAFDSIVQPKVREALERGMQELLGGRTTPEKLLENLQKVQEEANRGS